MNFSWQRARKSPQTAAREKAPSRRSRRSNVIMTSLEWSNMEQQACFDQSDVFAFLADPATHELREPIIRINTHGAAVFLAGKNVYTPLLSERENQGQVRRCHGDLHLRNIVLIEDRPVLFDAIEFDEAIATCDVLYDLAFLLMDLWTRGLRRHANLLFNRYLWICNDVERQLKGLSLLPLFLSLRSAIRAKVTILQPGSGDDQ